MALSLIESQAVAELAQFVYDFLPGTPMSDTSTSFPGVANSVGLGGFWQGSSKLPAIRVLLEMTLDQRRDLFCPLMIGIVQKGIAYRSKKGNPLRCSEVGQLNNLIAKLSFKIPELWDPKFLESLPHEPAVAKNVHRPMVPDFRGLQVELEALIELPAAKRGFAFERFLYKLFAAFALNPRGAFRLTGEQIDGSFELDHETYLLEAKWQEAQTGQSDLLEFRGKIEGKAQWSRGLFISHAGFTDDGLEAYSRGRPTNMIGMSGQDIYFILNRRLSLPEVLRKKIRVAGETGRFYVPVLELRLSATP